mmetsp:Transcript_9449/g.20251  ORF Transcript_9449/g.20251 Transcript_9449/m.20251 type:complete len:86 (+) Transcript_9449:388-645(+)
MPAPTPRQDDYADVQGEVPCEYYFDRIDVQQQRTDAVDDLPTTRVIEAAAAAGVVRSWGRSRASPAAASRAPETKAAIEKAAAAT